MPHPFRGSLLSRRRALAFGGGLLAAGPAAVSALALEPSSEQTSRSRSQEEAQKAATPPPPPTEVFQRALQTKGTVSQNVLKITLPRGDLLRVRGPHNLIFTPAWAVHNSWSIQTLPSGETMLNGEMALLETETNPVIDQLLAHGLVFQGFHQHFTGQDPQIWHVHMRGRGNAEELANALVAAIGATRTPFPAAPSPSNPPTPLDADALAGIIGGTAQVMEDGVVAVDVPRSNPMQLGGAYVSPDLALATHVRFKPLEGTSEGSGDHGPKIVAAAPDFGMTQDEVQKVMKAMRGAGWDVDCLYNQETDEHPQLYWSHQLKVGDATQLAHEVRSGMNQMNLKFKS